MAEIYHHLSKAPVFSSSHVTINEIQASAQQTLEFSDVGALAALGISDEMFRKGETSRTREVGAAARFLDLDGLIVPSARWPCANLVLFLDRLPDRDALKVVETRDINWPAWREEVGAPRGTLRQ